MSKLYFGALALLIFVVLGGCQSLPTRTEGGSFQFAVIGDNPYTDFNVPKYGRMIDRINAHPDLSWVIHVGDLKDSTLTCSDEVLQDFFDMNQQFEIPFVLTPGDNDWFDCIREAAGGWDRLDRLTKLREIFYPDPSKTTGGRPLTVTSQAGSADHPELVENVYWEKAGVVFATLHVVGITGQEGGLDLHAGLVEGALAWLDEVFAYARANNAKGVFLATQADPYVFTAERFLLQSVCERCPLVRPGYEALNDALLVHARAFERPIVLAVGDTHIFRVDKPLYDDEDLIENFTRAQPFGHPDVHWMRVVVNPDSTQVFEFHQEIIPENTGTGWNPIDE